MEYEEILKQPFDVKYIDMSGYNARDVDPEPNEGFEEFYARVQAAHQPKVLFKNFHVHLESCECGGDYGCNHPAYPSDITLNTPHKNSFRVEFEDDHGFSMEYAGQVIVLNKPETTVKDFLDALNLLKVPYELAKEPTTNREEHSREVAQKFLEWTESGMWTKWENKGAEFKYMDGWYNTHNYQAMNDPLTTDQLFEVFLKSPEYKLIAINRKVIPEYKP